VDKKKATETKESSLPPAADASQSSAATDQAARKNGGWREIEARREKAALKASLADVWDEDFDLDEEILAELDHTAEFFTTQDDEEEEVFDEDDDVDDEFFEED
jgi:hypothetical protein